MLSLIQIKEQFQSVTWRDSFIKTQLKIIIYEKCFVLLRLRVTEKVLQLPVQLLSCLLLLVGVLVIGWQKIFTNVSSFITQKVCDQDRAFFIGQLGKYFCQCSLYCKIWNWHVESCPSITDNIISPLPQCLWPPNFAGW